MRDLRILITGGTFDKEYDPIREVLTFYGTHLPAMLKRGRVNFSYITDILMLIDSLNMTEEDRELILQRCASSIEEKILITHGTGTMIETAKKLGSAQAAKVKGLEGKTIMLEGAMVPYSVDNSDALFNLGFGIGAVFCLPPGIYIGMNGLVLPWYDTSKNAETGVFHSKAKLI